MLTEYVELRFVNERHQQFHRILLEHDFSFEVGPDLKIGFRYKHPVKPVSVEIRGADTEDGVMEPICLKPNGDVYYTGDFSQAEFDWIFEQVADDFDSLRRELHVLLRVRPKSLNTMITLGR